jgi:hypothetical protein
LEVLFADGKRRIRVSDLTNYSPFGMGGPEERRRLGFWQLQARRFELRFMVMRYALVSVLFWTFAMLVVAWLRTIGLEAVAWIAGIIWLYFAVPTLYVHAQFILDVLGYAIMRRTYFFPELRKMAEDEEAEPRRIAAMTPRARAVYLALRPYFRAASFTSPLVGVATWSLIVLVRMPSSAHLQRTEARSEMIRVIRIGRGIETIVTDRYTGLHLGRVA